MQHRAVLESSYDLLKELSSVEKLYRSFQSLNPEFYHSEQILRLFLYENLSSILTTNKEIPHTFKSLALHLHSTNDICERCTHCLFLESEMSYTNTKEKRPKVKHGKESRIDPFGFFERFNGTLEVNKMIQYFITVSSETVGKARGQDHRYHNGHDGREDEPIDLVKFTPLLAFKTILNNVALKPLPPMLIASNPTIPEDINSTDIKSNLLLRQNYFPELQQSTN